MSKCVYCDSTKFGPGCPKSLNGLHKHLTDSRHCIYCGKSAYGNGCLQTPTRKHIHDHGDGKCVHCGVVANNTMGCPHSPNGKHET